MYIINRKENTIIIVVFSFLTLISCSPKMQSKLSDFELYKTYIQGILDNDEQVASEIKAGKQIHPYAKHVNRLLDAKIKNLPKEYNGFYILEESYYTYPNKPMEVKPYLFWFEKTAKGQVRLHSLQIPKSIDKNELRNDNQNLILDYKELKDSPTFNPATYIKTQKGFYIKAPIDLPNGMKFTLEETISSDTFEVMESLEKEGKLLTPYSTPIIYKRVLM
jgi:hypothetical protein